MALFPDVALSRPKRPDEEFRIAWDFANDLEATDSISAYEVKAYDTADGSDVSATLLDGPQLDGTMVRVQVQAGTDGHEYLVRFQATSTQGDKWQRIVQIRVRA